jgi:transposase
MVVDAGVMALAYLSTDRDQLFLLPPDVREWLPTGHLAWFVVDVVARVDTSALHARHPNDGAGRAAYDPDMLLALVLYAYCTGMRSSRKIERLCEVDVAYRVICANHVPDHTTIARFRQDHQPVAVELFTDVLVLCATAGLTSVGVVAVDGTKMGADASLKANRTRAQIKAEVAAMFDDAAVVDADEDCLFGEDRGDELPDELADPRRRGVRLDAALRQLEAQAAARRAAEAEAGAAQAAAYQARKAAAEADDQLVTGKVPAGVDGVAEAEEALRVQEERAAERARRRAEAEAAAAAKGRKLPGFAPDPYNTGDMRRTRRRVERAKAKAAKRAAAQAAAEAEAKANVTDPDSRVMNTPGGWVQGYNAQAAVNEHGIVLAGAVVQDGNDVGQCTPMMNATRERLDAAGIDEAIDIMLFDAGYWSEDNATAIGPDRLIATTKSWKLRRKARDNPTTGPPPAGASPAEAMEHRLCTDEGAALYAKRSTTVEPVFGNHKDGRGFRRFTRRGLAAVQSEWHLINTTHNMLKLFRQARAAAR